MKGNGFLLDSQILLWSLYESHKLSEAQAQSLESEAKTYVSAASVWELEIKKRTGKLPFPDQTWQRVDEVGHVFLPIGVDHARTAARLPMLHKDPFDRMLIAQAQIENLVLLSQDRQIGNYNVVVV